MTRQNHRVLRTQRQTKAQKRSQTLFFNWSDKHIDYIRKCRDNVYNIAEGAVRAGKTVDNVYAFAHELKTHPDKFFLATGATAANAKLNIAECNGMGLKYIFRGQCKMGKYEGNECLIICGPDTGYQEKIVIFAGGSKSNSYQKIRGNSYGMWIATEINQHHDSMIEEAFNRTLASSRRKFFWDLNPDHPRAQIYTKYIDKYVAGHKAGTLIGGVNYQKFTVFDNINISKANRDAFISQYEPGTIWYNRDILGMRAIAEGLIYRKMAAEWSMPPDEKKPHSLTVEDAKKLRYEKIVCAVDFGGNGSGHAFVAVGILAGYKGIALLKSRRYLEGDRDPDTGIPVRDVTTDMLSKLWIQFVKNVRETYGYVTATYGDSAEQVIIRDINAALIKASMGDIKLKNARKERINDRIFCFSNLADTGKVFFVETECTSVMDAISQAIWDPKNLTENERLDDGTSDIDSMDAMEYCIEHDIKKLIPKGMTN